MQKCTFKIYMLNNESWRCYTFFLFIKLYLFILYLHKQSIKWYFGGAFLDCLPLPYFINHRALQKIEILFIALVPLYVFTCFVNVTLHTKLEKIVNFTTLYWFCHISKRIRYRYTCVSHPEPSSLLPPHTIPLGPPSAPAPSIQYRASNLDC